MSMGAFWRRLTGYRQPHGELTVDLHCDDQMDLSVAFLHLSDAQLGQIGTDRAGRTRIMTALDAYALERHAQGVVIADQMVPVRLSRRDWKVVYDFCRAANALIPRGWPLRVLARVTAEVMKDMTKAGK